MWYNPEAFSRYEGDPGTYVIINKLRLQSMTVGQIHHNSGCLLTTRKSLGGKLLSFKLGIN